MPPEPKSATYEELATPIAASTATKPALGTYILFGINVAVFLAMVATGVSIVDPTTQEMLKWGADYGPYTFNGQYWRMITAMFLHFGIIHIAANMWCLWSLGRLAEKFVGTVPLIGIYLLTGIGCDLLSLSWDPIRVSAGASGAIFGIAGVLISLLQFGKLGLAPENVGRLRGYVVRFALLNLIIGLQSRIDNMGHLGGLVTGLLLGFFLARTFNSTAEERPARMRNVFTAGAVVLVVLCAFVARAKAYAADMTKAQAAYDQGNYSAAIEHAKKYAAARPGDEFASLLLGASYQKAGALDNAAHEYQRGLTINPKNEYIQVSLAEVYSAQKKPALALPLFRNNMKTVLDDSESTYYYAYTLAQTGDLAEAETALRTSLNTDNKLVESHQLLSEVLLKEGKTQEALNEKQTADSLEKTLPSENGNSKTNK
jgi:rhomboid protease GluP